MSRILSALSATIALAAVMVATTGCGGSSKSSTATKSDASVVTNQATDTTAAAPAALVIATGKPLTRKDWLAKGDAICAPVNVEVAAVTIHSSAEAADLMPQLALYYRGEASKISRLVPPVSVRSDAQQLVTGLSLLSEYLQRAGAAFQGGNTKAGGQLFRSALAEQRQPIDVAKRVGFKRCTATN